MKKFISVLAVAVFTAAFAHETSKKDCCVGKDQKECKKDAAKMAKSCGMKDHQDCKMDIKDCKEKKAAKKAA